MIRSLAAVIISVIAGLTAAKFIEGAGAGLMEEEPSSAAYGFVLSLSWLGGAFIAACVAMLIGKRWAPLGALSAGAIFLGAMLALFSNPVGWLMWPAAILSTGFGGYGAVRLLCARMRHPDLNRKDGLFDE